MNVEFSPRFGAVGWLRLALVVGFAAMAACAHASPDLTELAAFYWQYAPLAANVYDSKGISDNRIGIARASPWLQKSVRQLGDPQIASDFDTLTEAETKVRLDRHVRRFCSDDAGAGLTGDDYAIRYQQGLCKPAQDTSDPDTAVDQDGPAESIAHRDVADNHRFDNAKPSDVEDCEFHDRKAPSVPLDHAIETFKWERVNEFQKYTVARGWRFFLPGLAIDVWRRPRADVDGVEYAIVYRGTADGGGWASNIRILASITPLVWDQYFQAGQTTDEIVRQIYQLHFLADALLEKRKPTRILITAVGHSLGAGIASYVYYRNPHFTRAVGFDPSPVDGSSLIPVDQRAAVMQMQRPFPNSGVKSGHDGPRGTVVPVERYVDRSERDPAAPIFLLFEEGEILSRISPCHSGPLWGDEGGPSIRCESVNFSRGSWFRQHSMPQLACNLYLVQRDRPSRSAMVDE